MTRLSSVTQPSPSRGEALTGLARLLLLSSTLASGTYWSDLIADVYLYDRAVKP